MDLADLQRRFASPGIAIDAGPGGLVRVAVARGDTLGEVFLHGATVTRWRPPGGDDVLWVSGSSRWTASSPIRGGVPLCFPWFGAHPSRADAPAHGFARTAAWTLDAVEPLADGARVTLRLRDDERTRAWWPHRFALRLTATFSATLDIALGAALPDGEEVACEAALHSYFRIGDARRAAVRGLAGATFIDKTAGGARRLAEGEPLRIAAETDRVYLSATPTAIDDPVLRRTLTIGKRGSGATVVWNPWIAKAAAMADFGDEEWPGMLCVETANAADAAWRLGGAEREMGTTIGVAKVG